MHHVQPLFTLTLLATAPAVLAQDPITLIGSFNPADAGGFCGIAYDADSAVIWAYDCSTATLQQYTPAGASVRSIPRPGESSNDADLSMTPGEVVLDGSTVPHGRLLFFNGETGTADIYAIEQGPGTVIDTLVTAFGLHHVVGGAYHPMRNTFFLVQDDDANATDENRVAEVDPVSGEVLGTFQFTGTYAVNYGDLEISALSGNLFLVSNTRTDIAEFTPEGTLVQLHPLPDGVSALSGLSLDCATGTAWACSTGGVIYNLGGFPCEVNTGLGGPSVSDVDLRIWPNPATDEVWIDIGIAFNGPATVVLRDLMGRSVASMGPAVPSGSGQYVVDLNALAQGTYIVELRVGGWNWSRRIVKA